MLCPCIHCPNVIWKEMLLHMSSADGMGVTHSLLNEWIYAVVLCRILVDECVSMKLPVLPNKSLIF